jgi:hypothetical protein
MGKLLYLSDQIGMVLPAIKNEPTGVCVVLVIQHLSQFWPPTVKNNNTAAPDCWNFVDGKISDWCGHGGGHSV